MNIYIGVTGFRENVFDKALATRLITKDLNGLKDLHPNDVIVVTSEPPARGITELADKIAFDLGLKVSDTSFGDISILYAYGDWGCVKQESIDALLSNISLRSRALECISLPITEKLSRLMPVAITEHK